MSIPSAIGMRTDCAYCSAKTTAMTATVTTATWRAPAAGLSVDFGLDSAMGNRRIVPQRAAPTVLHTCWHPAHLKVLWCGSARLGFRFRAAGGTDRAGSRATGTIASA